MNDSSFNSEHISTEIDRSSAKKYFMQIGMAILVLRLSNVGLQRLMVWAVKSIEPLKAVIFSGANGEAVWWINWLISMLPLYLVAAPLFFITLPKRQTFGIKDKRKPFGIGRLAIACMISIAAMATLNYVGYFVTMFFNIISGGYLGRTDSLTNIVGSSPIWATLLGACIAAPIMEELIFRKLLIDRVKPFGELQACLLSGLIFGLFHGNFRQFFYAAVIGAVFAYVYCKTNNILYTIGMHMGINILGSVITPYFLSAERLSRMTELSEIIAKDTSGAVELLPEYLALILPVFILFGLGFLLSVGGAVALALILRKKKLKLDAPSVTVPDGVSGCIYANPAMIAAIVVMGASFVIALLP